MNNRYQTPHPRNPKPIDVATTFSNNFHHTFETIYDLLPGYTQADFF